MTGLNGVTKFVTGANALYEMLPRQAFEASGPVMNSFDPYDSCHLARGLLETTHVGISRIKSKKNQNCSSIVLNSKASNNRSDDEEDHVFPPYKEAELPMGNSRTKSTVDKRWRAN